MPVSPQNSFLYTDVVKLKETLMFTRQKRNVHNNGIKQLVAAKKYKENHSSTMFIGTMAAHDSFQFFIIQGECEKNCI